MQSRLRQSSQREKKMANVQKLNPRYNVLSLRVSDEEKETLDELSRRTRKSLSKMMREAVLLYSRDVELLAESSGCSV